MKTVTKDYPGTLIFKTRKHLPHFEYGEKVRTAIAQDHLRRKKEYWQDGCPHHYSDFIVEKIEIEENGNEIWHLGS